LHFAVEWANYNFTSPRQYLLFKAPNALTDLAYLSIGLLFWFAVRWKFQKESSIQLVSLTVLVALVIGFVQRLGNGVFVNAYFDLVIALSIGLGLLFTLLSQEGCYGIFLQCGGVMTLILFFALQASFLDILSPSYHAKFTKSEQLMTEHIEMVRAMPGDVFCESYVAYRAGKPFAVDALNVEERMRTGRLPKDTMIRCIQKHELQEVNYVWDTGIE
jgi:hypothetical protein